MAIIKLFLDEYPLTLAQAKLELNSAKNWLNNIPKGSKPDQNCIREIKELEKFIKNF